MYSVVLMAALATSSSATEFGHRGGCNGCWGGYASYYGSYYSGCHGGCLGYGSGCYGSYWGGGCHGGSGACFGYYSGWNCYGCHGCYGGYSGYGSCHGYYGSPYAVWGCYGSTFGYGYGCSGYYGCYGGHSAYGVPVPAESVAPSNVAPDSAAPNASAQDRQPELVPAPEPNRKATNPLIERKENKLPVAPLPDPVPEKKTQQSRAKVRFDVPADARVFVDGVRINLDNRQVFQTPVLDATKVYYYDVRVELTRAGQSVSDTQRLIIRPGQDVTASFGDLERRIDLASVSARD